MIRERVGGIVPTRYDSSVPAAVRLNESPEEFAGMAGDDLGLPRLELDASAMLSTRTMLREHPRPMFEVTRHGDHALVLADSARAVRWEQRVQGSSDPISDRSLILVEEDPEGMRAWHSTDTAIAEVHPEQVRVRGMLVLVEGFEPPLNRF